MKLWARLWYAGVWSDKPLRLRVAGEYRALATSKHLLADLAARNFVFAAAPDAKNLFDAGIAEGRRRAALEVLELTRIDPHELADMTVRPRRDDDAA